MLPRPLSRAPLALLVAAVLAPSTLLAQAPALGGRDPVLLCRGQDVPGQATFSGSHLGYAYHFASAENLATFKQDPDRFGVQLGGACARMGPLSGLGDPQRYHVHGERIYLFASDGCRAGFQKRPDAFLEQAAAAPSPDAAAKEAAATWIARAATGHGGKQALQALRSFRYETVDSKGESTTRTAVRVQWPLRLRVDTDYIYEGKSSRYSRVIGADDAYFVDKGKVRTMASDARTEVLRDLGHAPLLALRALLDGDAVAVPAGKRAVLGRDVDELAVWQHGRTTFLGLDAEGRIATARFHGRGPGLFFGAIELGFDEPKTLDGVVVPMRVHGTFDGKESPSLGEACSDVVLNQDLDPAPFTRPK